MAVLRISLIIVLPVNAEERPVRVPFATIDTIGVEGEDVIVALLDGARIEVVAESTPAELCDHLLARCCALPEVTRALRLVREWGELHRDELMAAWTHALAHEPLGTIEPLP